MEGNFKYTIEGQERKFFIGTYSVERTLEEMKVSISDISKVLKDQYLEFLRNMMYFSAEFVCELEGKDVDFTKKHPYLWIDNEGGLAGEFVSSFTNAMNKALGVKTDESEPESESEGTEKKSQ